MLFVSVYPEVESNTFCLHVCIVIRDVTLQNILYRDRCASLKCSILVEDKFVSHCCYMKEDGRSVDMRWRLDVRDYTGPIETRT